MDVLEGLADYLSNKGSYSCMIGYREGANVSPRKQMALPAGKEIKQWIPMGNYAGTSDISSMAFQTTDNSYYIAGFLDYIIGTPDVWTASPVKIDYKFKDLLS